MCNAVGDESHVKCDYLTQYSSNVVRIGPRFVPQIHRNCHWYQEAQNRHNDRVVSAKIIITIYLILLVMQFIDDRCHCFDGLE